MARPQLSHRNRLRVLSNVNDNYCVKCVTRLKDCACVSRKVQGLNPPPVIAWRLYQQERDCKFTCKFLCCESCSFCQRVSTKERCKSQLLLSPSKNEVCERCFLCRSLEFCKSCHKCHKCCSRLHQFWEKWAALGASPKVVLREGFTLPFRFRPNSTRSHNCHKLLCKPPQEPLLDGGFASAGEQKCSRTGHNSKISGVLETYLGPQHLEQLSKHRVVQNGDTRDNKCLPTGS